jgi:hypothetical protein
MNIESLHIYKVTIPGCLIFLVHDPNTSDFALNIIKKTDAPVEFMPYASCFGPLSFVEKAQISTLELLVLSGITEDRLVSEYQKYLGESYRLNPPE